MLPNSPVKCGEVSKFGEEGSGKRVISAGKEEKEKERTLERTYVRRGKTGKTTFLEVGG